MQSTELTESLAQKINETHAACMACDKNIVAAMVQKINLGRECGILLSMAKERQRPSEWTAWVQQNLSFSEESSDQYLYVAKKLADGPIDASNHQMVFSFAKPLAIATGELAAPQGHGNQVVHQPAFISYVARQMNSFKGEYEKQIKRRPINSWGRTELEQFVVQIEPVAEDINTWLMEAKQKLEQVEQGVAA